MRALPIFNNLLIITGLICMIIGILNRRIKLNLPLIGALLTGMGISIASISGLVDFIMSLIKR